jgi:biopolymer transport protein ExbB
MADSKTTTASGGGANEVKPASRFKALFPLLAIIVCAIIAHIIFYNVFGNCSNFEGSEDPCTNGHPINFFGVVFKGGFVIPIGMTLTLVLFTFTIERGFTIARASGKGNIDVFVKKVRGFLSKGEIDAATKACDSQQGSVGNVIKAGLRKYKEMEAATDIEKEQKKSTIQSELEEATMLELPMLERNLPIIATIASLGTLVGLIGTVLGMIRAFRALGAAGAPNAAELSVGISEALVNTALGITTSALAVVAYNFFTTKIDGMTYSMDEAGYSIVQTFDVRN